MAADAREETFRTQLEPHRRAITLHCYRMLGSLQDAEDVAQESLLRAWQRLDEVRTQSAVRSWLYKIATNACLDLLKARGRRRRLPHLVSPPGDAPGQLGPPADEGLWIEPAPDALFDVAANDAARPDARVSLRESVGLAFVTALQFLSPKQRAALILVDVLGWKPEETAALLEASVFSVNSLLQRARKIASARREDGPPPEASSSEDTAIRRYIDMWESGDLDAFTALLAEDARLSMPPQPEWFAGRDAIRRFLARILAAAPRQYRFVPLRANGDPAVAVYSRPMATSSAYQAAGITIVSVRDGRVSQLIRFTSAKLFPLFGFPGAVPPDD